MSIFEKLYTGKIYPMENTVPDTDEYKKAMHQLKVAFQNFKNPSIPTSARKDE